MVFVGASVYVCLNSGRYLVAYEVDSRIFNVIEATHMPAISGVRQRPPTEFIHYRVAQRRESPNAGDHSQLRLTPLPPAEFTASLLSENFRRYLLRQFFTARWFYSSSAISRHLPLQTLGHGLQEFLQTELQQYSHARVELGFRCTCIVRLVYVVGLGYYFAIWKGRIIACRC